ncbi:MAG: zf-HC2 domain-containing protein [Acidobacteria bacterium]|nr:zf-HC2 domain-containing protein [Acidobacteriota bacterium]MCZ6768626.1 zf-HC2 domain-containing protein [Acidobacteriota bacterium]MCZ6876577.1 zf-HC2 domain-containing protein [Acidobacteriota bacterium]
MTCQDLRQRIHDFLDGELPPKDFAVLNEHVKQCAGCQRYHDEFSWITKALSFERLPQSVQEALWKRIKTRAEDNLETRIVRLWDNFRTFWRDLDRSLLWSKLTAAPITLAFFLAILIQFGQVNFQDWTYPMMATVAPTSRPISGPLITQVSVRYGGAEIDDLMSAVWKMPFEDSLSLVAAITPEGSAEVGDVLEYPKSQELLRAIAVTLRSSQFQTAGAQNLDQPFVIYSFQKVDVYEDHKGL